MTIPDNILNLLKEKIQQLELSLKYAQDTLQRTKHELQEDEQRIKNITQQKEELEKFLKDNAT